MEGDRPLVDRRQRGVQTTKISDGNGGQLDLVSIAWSKFKIIGSGIIILASLVGAVFGAVRLGVATEVHQQIDREANDKNGSIRLQMEKCIEAHEKVVDEKFDEEFEKLDTRMREQKLVGVRTEEQLRALDRKVDANQQELLRAIQQSNGGSG
jgi:hypothetical protein